MRSFIGAAIGAVIGVFACGTTLKQCELPVRSTPVGYEYVVEAQEYTKGWEKLRLKAYKDNTRMSIGYGTKSYEGEVITKEEADKRFNDYWQENIPDLRKYVSNKGQYIALADTMYNKGGTAKKYTTNGKIDCEKIRYMSKINQKYYYGVKNRTEINYKLCTGELEWHTLYKE